MKKLNIGSGSDIKPKEKGWVNLDFMELEGVDVVHDLNKFPWPFKDNEFDVVLASHVLEHVNDLVKTMKEIRRISKRGARVIIYGPHFSCGVSYRDPTHKRFFSYFTFDYFTNSKEYYERDEKEYYRIKKRNLNFTRFAFPFLNKFLNPLINANPGIYERFFCWLLPVSEVRFELEVIK